MVTLATLQKLNTASSYCNLTKRQYTWKIIKLVQKRASSKMLRLKKCSPIISSNSHKRNGPQQYYLSLEKDKTLQIYVDYRILNAVSKRSSYPIPRIDECKALIGEATRFTTFNANSGKWQIEIDDADNNRTVITFHHGLYRYICMPFGLRTATDTYQQTINIDLSRVKWQFALVCLDKIVVFRKTLQQNISHVRRALSLLHIAGATLELKNCKLFTDTIDYICHQIRPRHSKLAPHSTDAICGLQTPTIFTKLRSLLSFRYDFRRFVFGLAQIVALLNELVKKNQSVFLSSLLCLAAMSFMLWKHSWTHWYPRQYWRFLTPVDTWSLTQRHKTSKLAVF